MRSALALALVFSAGVGVAGAQELSTGELATGEPVGAPIEILTIDQERLYVGSKFGQKILGDIDAQLRALQGENRKIESDLEAEEKQLTEQRKTLPADQFRKLADAFDEKVQQIRAARDAKERDIGLQRDMAQKKFLNAAVPILAQIMREQGASAIIDRKAVILSFDRIDITEVAIARIDAQLANQPESPAVPPPQPPGPDDQSQPAGDEPPIMPDPGLPPTAPAPSDGGTVTSP